MAQIRGCTAKSVAAMIDRSCNVSPTVTFVLKVDQKLGSLSISEDLVATRFIDQTLLSSGTVAGQQMNC